MSLTKVIVRFLLIFSVVYAVLIIPQTNLGQVYSRFIRTEGALLFGNFGENGRVKFEANFEDKNKWACRNKMLLFNQKHFEKSQRTGSTYQMAKVYDIWYFNYLFVALLVALIAATPMSLKRRVWAMIMGLVIIHVYINFGFFITLLFKFNSHTYLEVINLNAFSERLVGFIYHLLMVNPGTGIFIAVIIWLAVCFRKKDLSDLVNKITIAKAQTQL